MGERNSVTSAIEAALRGAGQRQSVIANNLANLETPGFHRSDLKFEDALQNALATGDDSALASLEPELIQPLDTPENGSGNNVNLDMEVGELLKNSTRYKTYMRLLGKIYRQEELAMQTEG